MEGLGLFALLLLAGMTFPLAFWIARICLAGVLVIIASDGRRRKGEALHPPGNLKPGRAQEHLCM
jgi:hypothetical protein